MIWAKSSQREERRVRDFLLSEPSCSETAASLARKLGLNQRRCRRALDVLATEGVVRRRDFSDIEPIYYRYPGRLDPR
jgi:predicted ArsR family transcriptional regulator